MAVAAVAVVGDPLLLDQSETMATLATVIVGHHQEVRLVALISTGAC